MSMSPTPGPADNVPNETILFYTHELSRTRRKQDEASSAHRLMIKRAKSDGVPTDAILESIALSRLDPEDRMKRMIDRIRVMTVRYPDTAPQFGTLFDRLDARVSDKMRMTDTLFDAETRGYLAGKAAVAVDDNPYEPGSELHQTWRNFWGQGQAANAASLGEGARAASTERKRPASAKQPNLSIVPDPPPRRAAAKKAGRKAPAKKPARKAAANGGDHPAEDTPPTALN